MSEEKLPALFLHSAIDDYDFTPEEFRVIHRVARRGECTESFLTMETHLHISESMIRRVVKFLVCHHILVRRDKLGSSSTIWVAPFDVWDSKESVDSGRPKQKGRRRAPAPESDGPLPETALPHPVLDGNATGRDGGADTSAPQRDGSGWEHDKGNPSKEIPKGNPLKVSQPRARETYDDDGSGSLAGERFVHIFWNEFEVKKGLRYFPSVSDNAAFVPMRVHYDPSEADWRRAVTNYLASPLRKHTLKDLSENYDVFFVSATDRFKVPVSANIRGHTVDLKTAKTVAAMDEFIERTSGNGKS